MAAWWAGTARAGRVAGFVVVAAAAAMLGREPGGGARLPRAAAAAEVDGDAVITARLKIALLEETRLDDSEVRVDTQDGVVTLAGTVASEAARMRALEIARSTSGVVGVDDRMTVATEPRPMSATTPAPAPR